MDDYELDFDTPCPKCGHTPIHYRRCQEIGCDDGLFDMSDEDPVNFSPGELLETCTACHGTGIETWCPNCGADLQDVQHVSHYEPFDGDYVDDGH